MKLEHDLQKYWLCLWGSFLETDSFGSQALHGCNASPRGVIKVGLAKVAFNDWAVCRGRALRCIVKQIEEIAKDPVSAKRCLDKAK